MSTPQDLLLELASLADDLAPSVAPPGADQALQTVVEVARALLGGAACSLAVLTEDESELHYVAATGQGSAEVTGLRIPSDRGLAGWVVQSGQPLAVSDLAGDSRFDRGTAERTGYVPQAMIVVPVATSRQTFGVLSLLDRDTARPDSSGDMTLLSRLGDQAALLLEASAAFRQVGSTLLAALATAAAQGSPLGPVLAEAGVAHKGRSAHLHSLGAALAELARRGPAERDLALGVLQQVSAYTGRRTSRTR